MHGFAVLVLKARERRGERSNFLKTQFRTAIKLFERDLQLASISWIRLIGY